MNDDSKSVGIPQFRGVFVDSTRDGDIEISQDSFSLKKTEKVIIPAQYVDLFPELIDQVREG